MVTGNLNVIPDARARNIISKGPKYRFPSNFDFPKCRREITAFLMTSGIVGVNEKMLNLTPLRNGRPSKPKFSFPNLSFCLYILQHPLALITCRWIAS